MVLSQNVPTGSLDRFHSVAARTDRRVSAIERVLARPVPVTTDDDWSTLDLLNNWVPYNTGPGLDLKLVNGVVYLRGTIKDGDLNETISVLPVGYRPDTELSMSVLAGAGTGELVIGVDGTITLTTGSHTKVSFATLTFPGTPLPKHGRLPSCVACWDTRTYAGGTVLENIGGAACRLDLHVAPLGAHGHEAWFWSYEETLSMSTVLGALGGDTNAPWSIIFATGVMMVENAYLPAAFYFWPTVDDPNWDIDKLDVGLSAWFYPNIDQTDLVYEISGFPNFGPGDTYEGEDPVSRYDLWVLEQDPVNSTNKLWKNNTLVATETLAFNATSPIIELYIYITSKESSERRSANGVPWAGIAGVAITRTVLTSDDRLAWANYFVPFTPQGV